VVVLNAASLKDLVNDVALADVTSEKIIDHSVNKINGYAKIDVVPNMTGAAGSKTLSVSSYEAGFIISVAIAVYNKDYKSSGAQSRSRGIGSLSVSSSSSSGATSEMETLARNAAESLRSLDVTVGPDITV